MVSSAKTAWVAGLATAVTLASASSLSAASLRITPVILELTAQGRSGAISVTNTSDEPVTLQIRVFRWTQKDGQDELVETNDVIASPPMAGINPGETYTLRVLRVSSAPLVGEEAYRLILDEIPKPADPSAAGQNVRMILRSSLPVFFAQSGSKPDLKFKAWTQDGRAFLQATNLGNRHAKLVGMQLTTEKGVIAFNGNRNGYILPGQSLQFEQLDLSTSPATQTEVQTKSALQSQNAQSTGELVSGIGSSLEVRQKIELQHQ